jgi:glycosyltransferase involved in cell wall biosynthesis
MEDNTILYISHTDIRSDSRILKAMEVGKLVSTRVIGVGMAEKVPKGTKESSWTDNIHSIEVLSRNWSFIPTPIRRVVVLSELYLRMFFICYKTRPVLVHCNDTLVLPVASLLKIFTKSRVIYDAHELESDKNSQSWIAGRIVFCIEKLLWPSLDGLIVVSPSILKWYSRKFSSKPCAVVLNAPKIHRENARRKKYDVRKTLGIDESEKIILYLGLMVSGRGIDLLIDAYEKYKIEAVLLFVGDGDYVPMILQKSAQNPKKIFYHSKVPHDEVVDISAAADLGVCLIENVSLSDYYSLPNKLFEYVFSNVPVLGSNFPDIAEFVTKNKVGMCVEMTVDSVGESLSSYFSEGSKVTVNRDLLYEYSWDFQSQILLGFYKERLNKERLNSKS